MKWNCFSTLQEKLCLAHCAVQSSYIFVITVGFIAIQITRNEIVSQLFWKIVSLARYVMKCFNIFVITVGFQRTLMGLLLIQFNPLFSIVTNFFPPIFRVDANWTISSSTSLRTLLTNWKDMIEAAMPRRLAKKNCKLFVYNCYVASLWYFSKIRKMVILLREQGSFSYRLLYVITVHIMLSTNVNFFL